MAFGQTNKRQFSEKQFSNVPLGGDGKSTLYEVPDNGRGGKCVLRGKFDVETVIQQLTMATEDPSNTEPGFVTLRIFRTDKEGRYFAAIGPIGEMRSGGSRGFTRKDEEERRPSKPTPTRSFKQRYEEEEPEEPELEEEEVEEEQEAPPPRPKKVAKAALPPAKPLSRVGKILAKAKAAKSINVRGKQPWKH